MKKEPAGAPGEDPGEIRALYEARRLDAIAKRWDARAPTWDRELSAPDCHLNHDDSYAWFLQVIGQIIAERSAFCAANGVIDSGCGTGLVLAAVAPCFAWSVGVDISPGMIESASRKQISGSRFVVGDCFRLPELCPKAGAVVSRGVLLSHYGMEQGTVLLRAVHSALVEGGFVACDFLNESARTVQIHAPENKTYYTSQKMVDLALEAGFKQATVIGEENRRVLVLVAQR